MEVRSSYYNNSRSGQVTAQSRIKPNKQGAHKIPRSDSSQAALRVTTRAGPRVPQHVRNFQ